VNARGPVIDADGHAAEDYEGFAALLPPSLRELAPRFEPDGRGAARLVTLEGRPWESMFPFTLSDSSRSRQDGIGDAATSVPARLEVLDAEGIDLSVIFPSLGL